MLTHHQTEARKLRNRLTHPIVDADGHWLEYSPVMREEFRRIGGDAAVEALAIASDRIPSSLRMSLAERRRRRVGQEAFWSSPSENVLDRATAMLPRLMYERLDDLGIDFSVVYPTAGLSYHRMQDTRLRRAICRTASSRPPSSPCTRPTRRSRRSSSPCGSSATRSSWSADSCAARCRRSPRSVPMPPASSSGTT